MYGDVVLHQMFLMELFCLTRKGRSALYARSYLFSVLILMPDNISCRDILVCVLIIVLQLELKVVY